MKWGVITLYLLSIAFLHFRGRVRLPMLRQFFDHSSIMAPINLFMYAFSGVPRRTPYFALSNFGELQLLQDNWETIRAEALHLTSLQKIRAAQKNDDAGFNSFFKNGWKRFYLKWYDASHPSAEELCPKTVALLRQLPSVKAAMFAELGPDGKLNPHRDPFAGSLRYHLGLVTPNSDDCRIYIDGEVYSWRDGQDVLFDETFIHSAENKTDVTRIILFCDVERPLRTRWMAAFNRWVSRNIIRASATQNVETEQVGTFNRIYALLGHGSDFLTRLKRKNRTMFRAVKYALIAGLVYWIFVA